MLINDKMTLSEVQRSFHKNYPGLKLEFYKYAHKDHEGSKNENRYDSSELIANIRTIHAEGELEVDPDMSISKLESSFKDMFGLNVQVFRKSNTIWLQTITTDNWTLSESNRKGLASKRK